MPIAFLCDHCGRRLEFPRSKAGQSVPCACGMTMKVPAEPAARSIAFNCPHCQKRFKARDDGAGQKIICQCGLRLVVPAAKRPADKRAAAKPATKRPAAKKAGAPAEKARAAQPKPRLAATISFNCHHCRKRFTVPADLAGEKGRCDCGLAYVVPTRAAIKAKQAKASPKPKAEAPKPLSRKAAGEQVVFNCPRCKRRISLPTAQAGRKANCTCGARFAVPTRGGRPPVDLNKPAPAKKP